MPVSSRERRDLSLGIVKKKSKLHTQVVVWVFLPNLQITHCCAALPMVLSRTEVNEASGSGS